MTIGHRISRLVYRLIEAVLPKSLFLPGLPQRALIALRVNAVPVGVALREDIRRIQRPVAIVLDPALALVRRVELPKAVATKADAALGLQLRQTLPGQGQGLVWRSMEIGRTGDKATYGVYIVKQSLLDDLLTELRGLGARVDRIDLGVPGLAPVWERHPATVQTAKNWAGFSALSVILVAVIAVIGLATDRSALVDLVSARSSQVEELERRFETKLTEADEGEKAAAAVLQDMAMFSAQSRRLQLLADLTAILPDTVWVSELSIAGDRLVMSGFSTSEVTEVISLVQSLPWARDVQLNGAISFDSYSGQNRFEIGLLISSEAPA